MRTTAEPSTSRIEIVRHNETTWYSINRAGPSEFQFIEDKFDFHPLDLADSKTHSGRPKMVARSTYLFLVLPFPVYRPNSDLTQSSELTVFLNDRDLITLHDGYLRPVSRIFGDCATNAELNDSYLGRGATHLLYAILDRLVDSCFSMISRFGERIAEVEDSLVAGPDRRSIVGLSMLRRDAVALRRIISSQPQLIAGLERAPRSNTKEDLATYWRDLSNRSSLLKEMTADHRELIGGLVTASDSLTNYRTSEAIKLVGVVILIVLPLSLVSGLWEMNFERLELSDIPFGFEIAVGLMTVIGVCTLVYLRVRTWF